MNKMLKDLDKVMDEAVYQRKRFSDKQKQEILEKVKKNNSRSHKMFSHRLHQVLSYAAVCVLFISVFSFVYIEKKQSAVGDEKEKEEEKMKMQELSDPVASLALLVRLEELLVREGKVVDASYFKNDKHINLTLTVTSDLSAIEMKDVANHFLQRGATIYSSLPSAQRFEGLINVWDAYTMAVTIQTVAPWNVNYGLGKKVLNTNQRVVLEGVKKENEENITWASHYE